MPAISDPHRHLQTAMREEIVAYMIYLERPKNPEYVMHMFDLKMGIYEVILSQLALPNKQRKIAENIRVVHNVMDLFLHQVFPGILQVMISKAWYCRFFKLSAKFPRKRQQTGPTTLTW